MSQPTVDPGSMLRPSIALVEYDAGCLDKSWKWLNDPEIRSLTLTPSFTREEQLRFFESLKQRKDYLIWGIQAGEGGLIGAAGLKNHRGARAEYWGYIGERNFWGKGFGRCLVAAVENEARERGFSELDLKVGRENHRALALYSKCGFEIDEQASTEGYFVMIKRGIR